MNREVSIKVIKGQNTQWVIEGQTPLKCVMNFEIKHNINQYIYKISRKQLNNNKK